MPANPDLRKLLGECPECGAGATAFSNEWGCGSKNPGQWGGFQSDLCKLVCAKRQIDSLQRKLGEAGEALEAILNFSSQPYIEKIAREALEKK